MQRDTTTPIEIVGPDAGARRLVRQLLEQVAGDRVSFVEPQAVLRIRAVRGAERDEVQDRLSSTVDLDVDGDDPLAQARRLWSCARRRQRLRRHRPGARDHVATVFDDYARALVLAAADGRVIDANAHARRLLGRTRSELLGAQLDELLAPGEPPLSRPRRGGSARLSHQRRRVLRADGSTIELAGSARPMVDSTSGRRTFAIELIDPLRDVAGTRTRAESAAIADAVRRVDGLAARGSHTQRVFGESLRRFCELLDADDAFIARYETPICELRLIAVQGQEDTLELGAVASLDSTSIDGTFLGDVLKSARPRVADEGEVGLPSPLGLKARNAMAVPLRRYGEVIGLLVVANSRRGFDESDIAWVQPLTAVCAGLLAEMHERERRRTFEEQLAENERTITNLLGNLPGVIFRALDDDLRTLTFASASVEGLLGRTPSNLIDASAGLQNFVEPSDRQAVLDELRWSILQRRPFEATYRMRRGDTTVWVREQSQAVFGPDGDLLFVEGFLTDVTSERQAAEERRRLESRVRRAQRLDSLASLAEGVAHDFNNLLLGVLGHASFLREHLDDDPEALVALGEIESAADRASDLTRYMLAYTEQEQVLPELHSVGDLICRSLPLLERELERSEQLKLELLDQRGTVLVDPGLFQRVLVEGLRNAVESFEGRPGRVTLRASTIELTADQITEHSLAGPAEPGPFVAVDIEDDGPGMEPAVLARAFDPYFSTHGHGRGLGLSAILGSVRAQGGALQLTSETGVGTRLRVLFPELDESDAPRVELTPSPPPDGASAEEGELPAARVLIVDDEPLVRDVARRLLLRSRFEVESVASGAEAIEALRLRPEAFDAALLDIAMPGLDGLATLEALRGIRHDLPVLMSSGFASQRTIERLQSLDRVQFLRKPYRLTQLVETLEAMLAESERVT